MKKLFLLSALFLFLGTSLRSQTCSPTPFLVQDTLHYYFNKYYFKTGQTTYTNYPIYKSPAATCPNAVITHVGSKFENCDTLWITGLEAFVAMPGKTAQTKYPVHMYLYNLGSNGLPSTVIDSVVTQLDGSFQNNPKLIGGNFTTTLATAPFTTTATHKLTGNYAVLLRNMSKVCGDTVVILRTAGLTPTNTAWNAGPFKYSDGGYGFVRFGKPNASFYTSRDFTLAPGFGIGTDYEFMVAPRVEYYAKADVVIPQAVKDFNDGTTTDTMCTRTTLSFTNISTCQYTNKFFNLNEFYRKWNLYSAFSGAPQCGGWSADTAIAMNFEFEENAMPPRDPRRFIQYVNSGPNNNAITIATDRPGCWDNQFRASLRPMAPFGRQCQIRCVIPIRTCFSYCDKDGEGLPTNILSDMRAYPNPMQNGQTVITGLKGSNLVEVYNMLGQRVQSVRTSEQQHAVDLGKESAGTYILKVKNENGQSRQLRLVNTK